MTDTDHNGDDEKLEDKETVQQERTYDPGDGEVLPILELLPKDIQQPEMIIILGLAMGLSAVEIARREHVHVNKVRKIAEARADVLAMVSDSEDAIMVRTARIVEWQCLQKVLEGLKCVKVARGNDVRALVDAAERLESLASTIMARVTAEKRRATKDITEQVGTDFQATAIEAIA